MKRIMIRLGGLVECALSLDDLAMQHAMKLEIDPKRSSHRQTAYWGEPHDVAILLDDVLSRSSEAGGWDQPKAWERACRLAFPKLIAQVEKQGWTVHVAGVGAMKKVTITSQWEQQEEGVETGIMINGRDASLVDLARLVGQKKRSS